MTSNYITIRVLKGSLRTQNFPKSTVFWSIDSLYRPSIDLVYLTLPPKSGWGINISLFCVFKDGNCMVGIFLLSSSETDRNEPEPGEDDLSTGSLMVWSRNFTMIRYVHMAPLNSKLRFLPHSSLAGSLSPSKTLWCPYTKHLCSSCTVQRCPEGKTPRHETLTCLTSWTKGEEEKKTHTHRECTLFLFSLFS